MQYRIRSIVLFALVATLVLAAAAPAADLPVETRDLHEVWSLGADEDDFVLGMITRVLGDESGTVYLLDTRQHVVHVIDPDGAYAGSLGREGDGPGEVREPRDVVFMPDGTVGLLKRLPGAIVRLQADGTPAGNLPIGGDADGGFTSLQQAKRGGNHLVVLGRHSRRTDTGMEWRYFLASAMADGGLGPELVGATATMDMALPVFHERDHYVRMFMPWSVGADGRVGLAPERDRYEVRVCDADGETAFVVTRDFAPVKRSGDLAAGLRSAFESCTRGRGAQVDFVIEEYAPAVADLHLDADGHLWVRHAGGLGRDPDVSTLAYDVYDTGGNPLKKVTLRGSDTGETDGLYLLPGGRAVLVRDHIFCRLVIDCQGMGAGSAPAVDEDLPLVTCFEIR